MKCPNCIFEIAENTKFCPECGTKIPETNTETTSSLEVTEEVSNAPSTTEGNELKKTKKKKLKKIIIISVSALLACGIIFLALYLLNPFCMFGHNMSMTNHVEPTCGAEGYDEYSCSDCDYSYKNTLSNHNIKHKWDTVPCGNKNHCLICGTTEVFSHALDYEYGVDAECKYCGEILYTIILPETPKTIHSFDYRGQKESSVIITDTRISIFHPDIVIDAGISTDVYITFTIQKTYDSEGNKHSSYGEIGWKLYDSKGKVVDSGIDYSNGQLCVGETSEICIALTPTLVNWSEYRLELLDIQ